MADVIRCCLEALCPLVGFNAHCDTLASREYDLLNTAHYSRGAAVMPLPRSLTTGPPTSMSQYLAQHGTLRRRAAKAAALGFSAREFEPRDWTTSMLLINRSTPERQGRPMDDHYWNYPGITGEVGKPLCPRHHQICYGVFDRTGELVAYSTFYRVGDLVHVSMILGHADHLKDGIMYLLMREALREQVGNGPGMLYYGLYDSGTDGLRFFKDRVGLREDEVWFEK